MTPAIEETDDPLSELRGTLEGSQALGDRVFPPDHWILRLSSSGPDRDEAFSELHTLLIRAAGHQVARMSEAAKFGHVQRDEIINTAANDAMVSLLARLDSFEGRSRFTTWAYKFGILQAGVEVRRAIWKNRDLRLHDIREPTTRPGASPEDFVEGGELANTLRAAMIESLTPRQRFVATALLIDGIPIDVLAERLETNRNALYKTVHEVRKRLRGALADQGYLSPTSSALTSSSDVVRAIAKDGK